MADLKSQVNIGVVLRFSSTECSRACPASTSSLFDLNGTELVSLRTPVCTPLFLTKNLSYKKITLDVDDVDIDDVVN